MQFAADAIPIGWTELRNSDQGHRILVGHQEYWGATIVRNSEDCGYIESSKE
jgi:hypothetical protein